MQAIVQSASTPFQTMTDVLRHFIEEGVERLPEMRTDPVLVAAAHMLELQRDVAKLDEYHKAQDTATNLQVAYREAKSLGDEKWIGDTREVIARYASSTPYPTIADRLNREL
jgi:hypothetical protein